MILERVSQNEGSNQKDIAKDTFKDPAALTRMLDILSIKGMVQRKPSKSDRRTFDIFLTVEGSRLVNRMTPLIDQLNQRIENALKKEEKKTLNTLLSKIQKDLA